MTLLFTERGRKTSSQFSHADTAPASSDTAPITTGSRWMESTPCFLLRRAAQIATNRREPKAGQA